MPKPPASVFCLLPDLPPRTHTNTCGKDTAGLALLFLLAPGGVATATIHSRLVLLCPAPSLGMIRILVTTEWLLLVTRIFF